MKWIFLLLLLSGSASAITIDQLFEAHGKRRVVDFVSEKSQGKVTIFINGTMKKAHRPALDYITEQTMRLDLQRINFTANSLNTYFLNENKRKEIENKRKEIEELKEAERRKSKPYILARQQRLKEEALRKQTDYKRENYASKLRKSAARAEPRYSSSAPSQNKIVGCSQAEKQLANNHFAKADKINSSYTNKASYDVRKTKKRQYEHEMAVGKSILSACSGVALPSDCVTKTNHWGDMSIGKTVCQ